MIVSLVALIHLKSLDVTLMNSIANQCKQHLIKKTGVSVGCFVGFHHHYFMSMGMHTYAYCYPLYKSGPKTGFVNDVGKIE